jgi:hypothetical protein
MVRTSFMGREQCGHEEAGAVVIRDLSVYDRYSENSRATYRAAVAMFVMKVEVGRRIGRSRSGPVLPLLAPDRFNISSSFPRHRAKFELCLILWAG